MSTSVSNSIAPKVSISSFAGNIEKAKTLSFVAVLTPGIVIGGGLAVSFLTKGKVNPVKFSYKAQVSEKIEKWMRGSVVIFTSTCVASAFASPIRKT